MEFFSAVIGIISSLIATLIWIVFTKLYDFESRKNIDYLLEMQCNCARQFEYAIEYSEYSVALVQADRMIDILREIRSNIKPFTYTRYKRKLILTYLYNALYMIDVFKNVTVGYSGVQEEDARCQQFKRKYLYEVPVDDNCTVPFLSFSMEIVQYLNRDFGVRKPLCNNLSIYDYKNKNAIYRSMVSIRTLKYESVTSRYSIRNDIFTVDEYNRYIDKKVKQTK